MKRLIFIACLLFLVQQVMAQNNLAPNPGFTNTSGVEASMETAALNTNLNDWKASSGCNGVTVCWSYPLTSMIVLADAHSNEFYGANNTSRVCEPDCKSQVKNELECELNAGNP